MLIAALALLCFDLGLLGGGACLIATGEVPLKIVGAFMVLVGLECRPRFPKTDGRFGRVSRTDAPALWEIVDQAAAALGCPRIAILEVDAQFNAGCMRSGVRRHPVLTIGLPLWAVLSPAAREALLGHELGHLVNGDPTTSFVSQPALTTFARLAEIFDPQSLASGRTTRTNVLSEVIATVIAYTLFAPIRLVCEWAHRGLIRVAARDHQRAEVYADALAVRLGGTVGAEELSRLLLLGARVTPLLRRAIRNSGPEPDAWRSAVEPALAVSDAELAVLEQSSLRYEANVYGTHPPSGLRRRLVTSWPHAEPTHPVAEAVHAAADQQLARRYARIAKQLH